MKRHWWIPLGLVLATVLAYWNLPQNDFINFDDPQYVTQNPNVLAGLSGDGFAWAFNLGYAGNWHPLTWLSHMLDVSLWGADPRGHHATSLVLHIGAVVVLYFLMLRMTGKEGRSAFVAAVFAVHPLHVESVAWAAERKDVLSALFGFLSIWFWVGWAQRSDSKERGSAYFASLSAFALSLAAKPMFVTLPFLLLLLDSWPLGRSKSQGGNVPFSARLKEKVPFFALALVSCILTVVAQSRGQAVIAVADLALSDRIGNAVSAYFGYLQNAFWPTRLAVFYPYPTEGPSAAGVVAGSLVLVAGTVVAWVQARHRPWFAVGWLWWLGMLVPVIGILQVGGQAMADRYTYVPLVGLSILCAWGIAELLGRSKAGRAVGWTAGIATLLAWIALTRVHVGYWKSDLTLFQRAVEVTDKNYFAHFQLGYDCWQAQRLDEAIGHYDQAVRLRPDMIEAHNNYGALLLTHGRMAAAIEQFSQAVEASPLMADLHFNLGEALLQSDRVPEAIESFRRGLELRPDLEDRRRRLEEMIQMQKGAPSAAPPK